MAYSPAPAPTRGFPSLICFLKASRICFRSVGGLIMVYVERSCVDRRSERVGRRDADECSKVRSFGPACANRHHCFSTREQSINKAVTYIHACLFRQVLQRDQVRLAIPASPGDNLANQLQPCHRPKRWHTLFFWGHAMYVHQECLWLSLNEAEEFPFPIEQTQRTPLPPHQAHRKRSQSCNSGRLRQIASLSRCYKHFPDNTDRPVRYIRPQRYQHSRSRKCDQTHDIMRLKLPQRDL